MLLYKQQILIKELSNINNSIRGKGWYIIIKA